MNDSSLDNNEDFDIKNFCLLAKYIRYQMLQANDDDIISKINKKGKK